MKYNKIVLVFPGQGSQYEGMGKELYDNPKVSKVVRDIYTQASDILHYNVADVCFREHKLKELVNRLNKELENRLKIKQYFNIRAPIDRTFYTQPAMLTTDYAFYKALEKRCNESGITLNPFLVAGHSLGEYAALTASGAIDFETSLKLVEKRAFYMEDVARWLKRYKLMIVLNKKEVDFSKVNDLCMEYASSLALINSQKQVVIGGPKKGLGVIRRKLNENDYITRFLDLEGPFHTHTMQPAAKRFNAELTRRDGESYTYPIKLAAVPIIANVTAEAMVDPDRIRQELYEQIYKVVNWKGSVEKALEQGADLFIEVGPKRILSGLIRDINPQVNILNVENTMSLEETVRGVGRLNEMGE